MLIAVASPEPDSNTMLPETMRAWSDLVFCVRLFTRLLKLQFSQEKEKGTDPRRDIVISLTPLYDAISESLAAPWCGLGPVLPIGDNPKDSHPLLNKYLCSTV
jgi:hypothetical protein